MAIHNDIQLRTATLADIDSIMKIESAGFIAQIQEAQTVFEKRIKVCPSLFLVFEDKASGKIVGYLSAEYMSHVPESGTQLALGHEPCAVVSSIIYISSFSHFSLAGKEVLSINYLSSSVDFFKLDFFALFS